MVNAYKLGKVKWVPAGEPGWFFPDDDEVVIEMVAGQWVNRLTEEALIACGATPIETESECECECACHWTKGDKPFHRYGQCKCEKPEREEIEMPEQVVVHAAHPHNGFDDYTITHGMRDWMKQTTDMLNRHEQLLREEA
jgi:hypothetical protein